MNVKIAITQDGEITAITQDGDFQQGATLLNNLLIALNANGLNLEQQGEIEQHIHGPDGEHIHAGGHHIHA